MWTRLLGLTTALAAVAVTAGCGLVGSEPDEPSQQSGRVTVGDASLKTQSVKCTQVDWAMNIVAQADPGRARVAMTLDGQKPVVTAVAFENIDGLSGVSGGKVGKAEASIKGNSRYTITGTATVTDSAHSAQTSEMPFKIEAPC